VSAPHDLDHAAAAADHILALVAAEDPTYPVTPEGHDTMVELVESVARLLLCGRRQ
jgi:hypothetical protein